jgi:hypothetical protein
VVRVHAATLAVRPALVALNQVAAILADFAKVVADLLLEDGAAAAALRAQGVADASSLLIGL